MHVHSAHPRQLSQLSKPTKPVKVLNKKEITLRRQVFQVWRVAYLSSTWVPQVEIVKAQVFQSWRIAHLTHLNQVTIQRAVHAEVRVGLVTQILKEFVGSHDLLKEKGYDEWLERAASGDDLDITMDLIKRTVTLRKKEKKVTFVTEPREQDLSPVTIMMSKWSHHVRTSWTFDDMD